MRPANHRSRVNRNSTSTVMLAVVGIIPILLTGGCHAFAPPRVTAIRTPALVRSSSRIEPSPPLALVTRRSKRSSTNSALAAGGPEDDDEGGIDFFSVLLIGYVVFAVADSLFHFTPDKPYNQAFFEGLAKVLNENHAANTAAADAAAANGIGGGGL
eukprot:CAMPEP_0172449064 /NCGR_PEP_ID=MMETSP1065-20121228/7881_1 /TAXON_ID=265537 /ORGANISM="Amphiprora paludosa, Strain CCMP125" /LENGTH=156 /DNA_ID=CAMNT_0013200663 /DNA_START=91 /DNA_END=561 /DNA_ORIENTATION=+